MKLLNLKSKIQDIETASKTVSEWLGDNKKIVFTNGCFDLLHYGHINYLNRAADLGNKLVVGINSDASVSKLKGAHRPLQNEFARLHIMAALECVDLVILFEEETPLNLIKSIKPNILVKGGDYEIKDIVGADLVLKNGGSVKTLDFIDGYSTSAIEAKIRNS